MYARRGNSLALKKAMCFWCMIATSAGLEVQSMQKAYLRVQAEFLCL